MSAVIFNAPWTPQEVRYLNRWQRSDAVHPFTCTGDHDGEHDLVATVNGWICPYCDYTQNWAYKSMMYNPEHLSSEVVVFTHLEFKLLRAAMSTADGESWPMGNMAQALRDLEPQDLADLISSVEEKIQVGLQIRDS